MSKNNQIENNQKLKSLKIQNTDTQLSERIDGVTSQVFPDSDIIKKTDVSNTCLYRVWQAFRWFGRVQG